MNAIPLMSDLERNCPIEYLPVKPPTVAERANRERQRIAILTTEFNRAADLRVQARTLRAA